MVLLWPVLLLFATGLVAAWTRPRGRAVLLFALPPAVACAWLAAELAALPPGGALSVSLPWFPQLGAGLDLRLDGFSGLMAVLATGVGALIVVYTSGYLKGHPQMGRFLLLLFAFMASMLGVVLADNLILLFVFWELTGITSYLLIGFNHEEKSARAKALQALLVTGTGALALLAGLVLLGQAAGTWNLTDVLAAGEAVRTSPYFTACTLLILAGALTKSAQVPFHFWLPNAMAAPTPVSAFLHSATMVKAGVFLLAKFSPLFAGSLLWHGTLTVLGALTLLVGAGVGLFQTDLKRILAHTTLAVLGALTLLVGVGTDYAIQSMVVFLLGHALYKAALFMVAGTIDHETGTRDVRLLRGLRRAMPLTATAAVLAAFSKAGFPPFFGFIGKEYVYKTGTALDQAGPFLLGVTVLGNMLLLALALKAGWHPFWGAKQVPETTTVHEGDATLWAPPLLLALAGLALGLLPGWSSDTIVGPAVWSIAGREIPVALSLWQGVNLPLILSALTVAGGLLLYRQRRVMWPHRERVESLPGPANVYERGLQRTVAFAVDHTRFLQSGALRNYVFIVIAATTTLLFWKFARFDEWPALPAMGGSGILPIALCVVVMLGAVTAATVRSRVTAMLALGFVGFSIALLFLEFSAPDLALTQILVETLTVVMLLLVVHRLPPVRREGWSLETARNLALAVTMGAGMGLLALRALELQLMPGIGETLAQWSYPLAHGRNVVNVILVDFRALDTFGEIIVLAIAALGMASVLAGLGDKAAGPSAAPSFILRRGARMLLPWLLVLSLLAFYRGHHLPGGGFIGGLLAASGFALVAVAEGALEARRRLRFSPVGIMGAGLVVALGAGLSGLASGRSLFSGLWLPEFHLPLLGAVHLGTPMLFDAGVYLTVVGFALHAFFALQEVDA